ncbi:hypothetical protein QJQ45_025423, partial [Haematococcus lacustris]
ITGREASLAQLEAVHEPELVQEVQAVCAQLASRAAGFIHDCPLHPATYHCARLAAGSAVEVALAVARGQARSGAAIIRPPGHHAESGLALGFCLFNNAAVAARAAQRRLRVRLCGPTQEAGVQRVLIVDWDIHHGNGTQVGLVFLDSGSTWEVQAAAAQLRRLRLTPAPPPALRHTDPQAMFYGDASVLYISIHRWDNGLFFPGTGAAAEVGHGGACGYTVNIPWNGPGAQDGDYLAAFRHVLLPIAQDFAPGLVLVSAGFDAAEGDPLGECHVSPALYAHMTQMLLGIGPLVLLLEGGYNLAATAECTAACIRVQLGEQPPDLPPGPQQQMSSQAKQALVSTLQAHAPHWQPAVDELAKVQQLGVRGVGGGGRGVKAPCMEHGGVDEEMGGAEDLMVQPPGTTAAAVAAAVSAVALGQEAHGASHMGRGTMEGSPRGSLPVWVGQGGWEQQGGGPWSEGQQQPGATSASGYLEEQAMLSEGPGTGLHDSMRNLHGMEMDMQTNKTCLMDMQACMGGSPLSIGLSLGRWDEM